MIIMEVRTDYEKLYDVGSDVVKNNEDLLNEFNKLLEILDDMQNHWDGTDFSNFKTTAVEYINNQRDLISELDFMGKYMTYASGVYRNINETWGEKMKRIGEDYDDEKRDD